MTRFLLLAGAILLLAMTVPSLGAVQQVETCGTTSPEAPPFILPFPFVQKTPQDMFWHGTDALWTWLRVDGRAIRRDKSFWWHPGFNGNLENRPALRIEAIERQSNARYAPQSATNAQAESLGGWAMLTMLEFPQAGCWNVTATYQGASVSYVVAVN